MEYTVEIAIATKKPLTAEQLESVAEVGGAAAGDVGGMRVETVLTVRAKDHPGAAAKAIETITARVAGDVIAVEVMTTDEQDRRLAVPAPEYVGIAEIAELLGVSRQRVDQLQSRQDFPAPVARLAAGPVWRKGDLSTFADGWQRKAGRPPKEAASA